MGWATSGMGGADEIFNIPIRGSLRQVQGQPGQISMHIRKKDPDPRERSVRTHGMRKVGGIRWKFFFDVRKPLTVRQLWGFNPFRPHVVSHNVKSHAKAFKLRGYSNLHSSTVGFVGFRGTGGHGGWSNCPGAPEPGPP